MTSQISRWPWWVLVMVLLGILFAWKITTDQDYTKIFNALRDGITTTLYVTFIAYTLALVLGLLIALARISNNFFAYQISTFYVELIRGLPTLVILLYVVFVIFPGLINLLARFGTWLMLDTYFPGISHLDIRIVRELGFRMGARFYEVNFINSWGYSLSILRSPTVPYDVRVIVALAVAYSAFLSEIFRGGIESVQWGQMEAARALGMTYWQAMWHIILRQAIRAVLPPLGNDFISMLKDSSLAQMVGVAEMTQRAVVYEARSFRTFETYNVLAYLYLVMTLLLSMMVKLLERYMARERRR